MNDRLNLTDEDVRDFWSKVKKTSGCWLWTGALSGSRYGNWKRHHLAHRVSFYLATGQDISGQHLRHTCDNPACVNPEHLVPGTRSENMQDMCLKGRHARTKLSSQDIRTIQGADGLSQRKLAEIFGVHQATIHRVLRGKTAQSHAIATSRIEYARSVTPVPSEE